MTKILSRKSCKLTCRFSSMQTNSTGSSTNGNWWSYKLKDWEYGDKLLRKGKLIATGSLQLFAGQDAGSEATIHAVDHRLNEDGTKTVLMVDAWNAVNSVNRKALQK